MKTRHIYIVLVALFAVGCVASQNAEELFIPEETDNQFPPDHSESDGLAEVSESTAIDTHVAETTTESNPITESEAVDSTILTTNENQQVTIKTSDFTQIPCPKACVCNIEDDSSSYEVDCSAKDLTEFPVLLDSRITTLKLHNNRLTIIPKAISKLKNLKVLIVNDNQITELESESISELPELVTLNLANNGFTVYPKDLENSLHLDKLQELDLGGNEIKTMFTAKTFVNFNALQTLTLPEVSSNLQLELCSFLKKTLINVCTRTCKEHEFQCSDAPVIIRDETPIATLPGMISFSPGTVQNSNDMSANLIPDSPETQFNLETKEISDALSDQGGSSPNSEKKEVVDSSLVPDLTETMELETKQIAESMPISVISDTSKPNDTHISTLDTLSNPEPQEIPDITEASKTTSNLILTDTHIYTLNELGTETASTRDIRETLDADGTPTSAKIETTSNSEITHTTTVAEASEIPSSEDLTKTSVTTLPESTSNYEVTGTQFTEFSAESNTPTSPNQTPALIPVVSEILSNPVETKETPKTTTISEPPGTQSTLETTHTPGTTLYPVTPEPNLGIINTSQTTQDTSSFNETPEPTLIPLISAIMSDPESKETPFTTTASEASETQSTWEITKTADPIATETEANGPKEISETTPVSDISDTSNTSESPEPTLILVASETPSDHRTKEITDITEQSTLASVAHEMSTNVKTTETLKPTLASDVIKSDLNLEAKSDSTLSILESSEKLSSSGPVEIPDTTLLSRATEITISPESEESPDTTPVPAVPGIVFKPNIFEDLPITTELQKQTNSENKENMNTQSVPDTSETLSIANHGMPPVLKALGISTKGKVTTVPIPNVAETSDLEIKEAAEKSPESKVKEMSSVVNDDLPKFILRTAVNNIPQEKLAIQNITTEPNGETSTNPTEVKIGAATETKSSGGVDKSVIAVIVAGMVIIVAVITIKKNWSSIKKRFSSTPRPNDRSGRTANGTAPEEVPLQDKSPV